MIYQWKRQTIADTFERICQQPDQPWVAIGDFIDDWHRSAIEDRHDLIEIGINDAQDSLDLRRWAAFCAAMVEWLCWQDGLPFPPWTNQPQYHLPEPWFLYPGDLLRAWQLTSTPTPFKMRNIFGGDAILNRV